MENNMKFSEYMNAKGKTVEQPVVAQLADKLEVEPKPISKAQALNKKLTSLISHPQLKSSRLEPKRIWEFIPITSTSHIYQPFRIVAFKNWKPPSKRLFWETHPLKNQGG